MNDSDIDGEKDIEVEEERNRSGEKEVGKNKIEKICDLEDGEVEGRKDGKVEKEMNAGVMVGELKTGKKLVRWRCKM